MSNSDVKIDQDQSCEKKKGEQFVSKAFYI